MKKHGRYDPQKQIPDNSGQPRGSGLVVWLHEQVCTRFEDGADLIEASRLHGSSQRKWLIERLRERGATDLAQEFRRRYNALHNAAEWDAKRREVSKLEALVEAGREADDTPMSLEREEYLSKRVEKLRRSIEKHESKGE